MWSASRERRFSSLQAKESAAPRGALQETLVNDLDVRFGFPFWIRPFVSKGVEGITLGSRVYLSPSVAGLPLPRIISILHHEAVHVRQVRRLGFVRFIARYVWEYARNRARGLSTGEAYRQVSFEKEAFAEELRMERDTNA